jgi:(1->4)-alpha-D-glucan 1-alpha-D-glucosylmutase
MLATSTHDTKRGEDTRARLAVLSEMPEEWERQVQTWSRILRARRGDVEGTAPPDRNDEYLFYQLLLGAWPAELTGIGSPDAQAVRSFAERIEGAMIKSMREAKLHSTWASPNADYEEAMLAFVREALDTSRAAFLDAFLPFQERVARLGFRNSLVQTMLKLTVPGMPDIYQGCELWDLSLVDPDNRRAIDYEHRRSLLAALEPTLRGNRRGAMIDMLETWRDGRLKLALTSLLLAHRRARPELFAAGNYETLVAIGSRADHVCAFVRARDDEVLLVVAARFPAKLEEDADWGDTAIEWPQRLAARSHWRNLFTGQAFERREALEIGAVLADLPVAVLVTEDGITRS